MSLTTNLRALHDLTQAIMTRENCHLYEFTIGERVCGELVPEDAHWDRKVGNTKRSSDNDLAADGTDLSA